jgi:hypothetical protein
VYDDDALSVAAALMQRLWRPSPDDVQWRRLETEAERWRITLNEDATSVVNVDP